MNAQSWPVFSRYLFINQIKRIISNRIGKMYSGTKQVKKTFGALYKRFEALHSKAFEWPVRFLLCRARSLARNTAAKSVLN